MEHTTATACFAELLKHAPLKDGKIAAADLEVAKAAWEKFPKGWDKESAEKFWKTLTGDKKHKRTACMKALKGTEITEPGAFCNSLHTMFESHASTNDMEAAVGALMEHAPSYANGKVCAADAAICMAAWESLPKNWTKDTVKEFWKTLTGDKKHKRTACMKALKGSGISNLGAFCNSLYHKFEAKSTAECECKCKMCQGVDCNCGGNCEECMNHKAGLHAEADVSPYEFRTPENKAKFAHLQALIEQLEKEAKDFSDASIKKILSKTVQDLEKQKVELERHMNIW